MIIHLDETLLLQGYKKDGFVEKIWNLRGKLDGVEERDGLLFIGQRLVVPRVGSLQEPIFRLARSAVDYPGGDISFTNLRNAYYWPRMKGDLVGTRSHRRSNSCPGCTCINNAVDTQGSSVQLQFLGPLPEDRGLNAAMVIVDRLGGDIRIAPYRMHASAEELAEIFIDAWYYENGLPREILSDRGEGFAKVFLRALRKCPDIAIGTRPKMSGISACCGSNSHIEHRIRMYLDQNKANWTSGLRRLRFELMNEVDTVTGITRFEMHIGRTPRGASIALAARAHPPPQNTTNKKVPSSDNTAMIKSDELVPPRPYDKIMDYYTTYFSAVIVSSSR